jgi:hypothetical protein
MEYRHRLVGGPAPVRAAKAVQGLPRFFRRLEELRRGVLHALEPRKDYRVIRDRFPVSLVKRIDLLVISALVIVQ